MKKNLKSINLDIGEMHSHTWNEGLNGIKNTWFKRTIPIDKLKGYVCCSEKIENIYKLLLIFVFLLLKKQV